MEANVIRVEPIPDSEEMGPAMRAISPQQRAFVVAYLAEGKANASAAARAAGYGADSATPEQAKTAAKVSGWRLIHDDRILAAVKEMAEKRLHAFTYRAAQALIDIAEDPTHKDRFKAADRLLGQGGIIAAVAEQKVVVEHRTEKRSDILKRIEALADKHGKALPQSLQERISAARLETVRVLPAPAEAARSSEGLEDLL